ncbi:hypothetical protein [Lactococcus lactis]|uniref:hypothetical protein n=1 Tax=Lactococcus lactis TaxID=1358 RepID=UPI0018C469D9|nr:hypothetical protein [Lactococcus lactis]MBG1279296.1 hypothetical protein [Lactococcus lactis subsp. lactis]
MPRLTKYESHIEPRLDEIKAWRAQRLSIPEIANRLSVGFSTLNKERYHPELEEALKMPDLSPEEQRKRQRNAVVNHEKYFNSTLSFVRRHANEYERLRVFEVGVKKIETLRELEDIQLLIAQREKELKSKR